MSLYVNIENNRFYVKFRHIFCKLEIEDTKNTKNRNKLQMTISQAKNKIQRSTTAQIEGFT